MLHPDLVKRLVLVGAGGLDTPMGEVRLRKVGDLEGPERYDAVRDNLLGLMLHDPASADALAVYLQESNVGRARLNPRALVLPARLIEVLPHIRVPLGAIWGAEDRPHPAEGGQEAAIRRSHPDLLFRVVAGAGHWVMYEQPEAFNRTLLELLAEL